MEYKLQYKSVFAKAYHSFLFYVCFAVIALLLFLVIDLLFLIVFSLFAAKHLSITEQGIYDFAGLVLVIEFFISIFVALKCNKRYVTISPQGVFIHNSNTEHFGLGQRNRLNVIVPFECIADCFIEIPADCPQNYKYKKYNRFGSNGIYFDYRRKVGVVKTKEPAISGGRYDEECILLELDNKRIVVIPIDECHEFLELFNQYFEQYKKLQRKQEDKE